MWIAIIANFLVFLGNCFTLWLNTRIQGSVNHHYAEKIEEYKHNLSKIAKQAEFDYTRMNQDFNLWTNKRHDAYANIYNAICEAEGCLKQLRGVIQVPDFERFSLNEISQWMTNEKFLDVDIKTVTNIWDNRKQALPVLFKLFHESRKEKARIALHKAHDLIAYSRIYLSENLLDLLWNQIDNLQDQLGNFCYPTTSDKKDENERELAKKIPDNRKIIARIMRKELSGGFEVDENEKH